MSAVNAQPPHPQGESADNRPTEMEDILASIRRIIADDQSRYAPFRRQPQAQPVEEPPPPPAPVPQPVVQAPAVLRETPILPRIEDPVILSEPTIQSIAAAFSQPSPAAPAPAAPPVQTLADPVHAPRVELEHDEAAIDEIANAGAAAVLRPSFGQVSATSPGELRSRASLSFQAEPTAADPAPSHPAETFEPEPLMSDVAGASIEASFHELATSIFTKNTEMVEGMMRDMLRPMLKSWLDDNLPSIVERLVRSEIERVARGRRG